MKWADWYYFNRKWQYSSGLQDLRKQRAFGKMTRREYKAGIDLIKQDVLKTMLQEGKITEEDIRCPGPPQYKVQKPSLPGKRVSINKALPAHGKPHQSQTLWKYISKYPGGLPGLGKKR
ncbi:MAG: hypothetical protein ACYDA9_17615 [Terriglobia bacterium]